MNNKLQELINLKETTIAVKHTLKNYIELRPNPESWDPIPNNYSYFGGYPYLPKNEQYPVDENGNNLQLLLQLNFDGLDVDHAKGLLQIFIDPFMDNWGMNISNPNYQGNFRLKYYPTINNTDVVQDFEFLKYDKHKEGYRNFFLQDFEVLNIDFYPKKMSITPADFHYELLLPELSYTTNPLGYHDYDNKAIKSGHRLGGYPNFIQQDPRLNQIFADYVLLLQIDSYQPFWTWGKNGVATFLIHPADFEKQDFSKVLFYWDSN